jgi:NADPH:quinone reductase
LRAAVVKQLGAPPEPDEIEEPARGEGQALLEVLAAPLNPVDLSIASGRFYGGAPETPYVPGVEGVGRVLESDSLDPDALAYFQPSSGSFAERAVADEATVIELPPGTDPLVAACLGVAGLAAWLPLEQRAKVREGERVLVLGATGAVGQIGVQAAKLLGAGTVIAAGRNAEALARARELGADATVDLTARDDLPAAFTEAAGGPIDVTLDPLWGEPAVAAAEASAVEGRLVNVGQSASPDATFTSSAVRGRRLAILGHANQQVPPEVRRDAYLKMLEHAAAGRLRVKHEELPLERVAEVWERQAAWPHEKLVLVPSAG